MPSTPLRLGEAAVGRQAGVDLLLEELLDLARRRSPSSSRCLPDSGSGRFGLRSTRSGPPPAGDVERGAHEVLDALGGHHHGQVALLVHGVGLGGVGERVEREVVGVLHPARAGDLHAEGQARGLVLRLAELEDAGGGLGGDGEDGEVGLRGSVTSVASAMEIRLTSGPVTDTTGQPHRRRPNEGHGPRCLYEVADHIATITLNRPHRRNAHLRGDARSSSNT